MRVALEQAIDLAQATPPGSTLIGLTMSPGIDGYETTCRLKSNDAHCEAVRRVNATDSMRVGRKPRFSTDGISLLALERTAAHGLNYGGDA